MFDFGVTFTQLMAEAFRFLTYEWLLGGFYVSIWECSLCIEVFIIFMSNIARFFGKQEIV